MSEMIDRIAATPEDKEDKSVYRTEEKKLLSVREFLNLPYNYSTAAIVLKAVLTKEFKDDKLINVWLDNSFSLSDCNNQINLAFSINDKESFDNSIFKVDTLLDSIRKFKSALIKAREAKLEVEKNNKKLNKPKVNGSN